MIKIQTKASHLSAHDFRLFSTIHRGSVTNSFANVQFTWECIVQLNGLIGCFDSLRPSQQFSSREPKAQGKLLSFVFAWRASVSP